MLAQRFVYTAFIFIWTFIYAKAQRVETIFLAPSKVIVGEPYLRFDPFTVENDILKQAFSKEMRMQDREGYLWFVADNQTLIRYDGHYSKVYDSLSYYGINITPKGQVWSLTDKGVALYSPINEKFEFFHTPLVQNYQVWGSTSAADGKIYFLFPATTNNVRAPVFEFNPQNKKFRHIKLPAILNGYTQQYDSDTSLVLLKPLHTDTKGRIWGVVYTASDKHRPHSCLGYYHPSSNVLTRYPLGNAHDPDSKSKTQAFQELDINSVLTDSSAQNVWVGAWGHYGLLRFHLPSGTWKQYHFPNLDANQIYQLNPFTDHKILLITKQGVHIFDTISETLHLYPHIPGDKYSPPTHPNSAFIGSHNTVWVGKAIANGDASVAYLNLENQLFKKIPLKIQYDKVRILCQHQRYLYFTYETPQGFVLARYNEKSEQITSLLRQPIPKKPEQIINQAYADSINQVIWFVGKIEGGSIWQWDLRQQRMLNIKVPIQNTLLHTHELYQVMSIAPDKAGNIWIPVTYATPSTEGLLIKYNATARTFTNIKSIEKEINNQRLRCAMVDHRGIVWMGSWDDNLIRWYDPKTDKLILKDAIYKSSPVTNISINKIVEDPKRGVVWIAATDHGLWKYDFSTDQWKRVALDPKDVVINIHLTDDGSVWLKSANALIHYIPETGQIKYLGAEYDLRIFQLGTFVKGDKGELFFDKFRFYPSDIRRTKQTPKVVFSFLKVFDKELPLAKNLNLTSQITLDYNQNFFTIGFSAFSYTQNHKNQYAYRLIGFNKEWVMCGNIPLATFTNVPPGKYTLQIKGANFEGTWGNIRAISIIIEPPFWKTWWFMSLLAIATAAIVYTLYRYRLAQQTLKSRLEAQEALRQQREAQYQQHIAQTEIAALRAQMNPHFIFNCLNSIQYFAARNDADTASEYLSKFSRLIRLVLENSRSEKVTLLNELETLKLYIEMEAMRFQQKVRYQFEIDASVDTENIQIPPLLIQPFVENAIWHGLMHKPEGGMVSINVQQPHDNLLRVMVIDDGVGRAQAAQFKSKSATKQKSFGMKVTAERIDLINQFYRTHSKIQIVDLKDAFDKAQGTKIIIEIPL